MGVGVAEAIPGVFAAQVPIVGQGIVQTGTQCGAIFGVLDRRNGRATGRLHIGVEVVVSHLDGDPDRPVIVASPPNTKTITPVTSNNATQSKIRTQTGIRITFDDDVV